MGVFDTRDDPSHGSTVGDGTSEAGEPGESDESDESADADERVPILEGHAVWFNEYRH